MQAINDYMQRLRSISLPDSIKNFSLPPLTQQQKIIAAALAVFAAVGLLSFFVYRRYFRAVEAKKAPDVKVAGVASLGVKVIEAAKEKTKEKEKVSKEPSKSHSQGNVEKKEGTTKGKSAGNVAAQPASEGQKALPKASPPVKPPALLFNADDLAAARLKKAEAPGTGRKTNHVITALQSQIEKKTPQGKATEESENWDDSPEETERLYRQSQLASNPMNMLSTSVVPLDDELSSPLAELKLELLPKAKRYTIALGLMETCEAYHMLRSIKGFLKYLCHRCKKEGHDFNQLMQIAASDQAKLKINKYFRSDIKWDGELPPHSTKGTDRLWSNLYQEKQQLFKSLRSQHGPKVKFDKTHIAEAVLKASELLDECYGILENFSRSMKNENNKSEDFTYETYREARSQFFEYRSDNLQMMVDNKDEIVEFLESKGIAEKIRNKI